MLLCVSYKHKQLTDDAHVRLMTTNNISDDRAHIENDFVAIKGNNNKQLKLKNMLFFLKQKKFQQNELAKQTIKLIKSTRNQSYITKKKYNVINHNYGVLKREHSCQTDSDMIDLSEEHSCVSTSGFSTNGTTTNTNTSGSVVSSSNSYSNANGYSEASDSVISDLQSSVSTYQQPHHPPTETPYNPNQMSKNQNVPQQTTYKCQACGTTYSGRSELAHHWKQHTSGKAQDLQHRRFIKYQCQFCNTFFPNAALKTSHINARHAKQQRKQDFLFSCQRPSKNNVQRLCGGAVYAARKSQNTFPFVYKCKKCKSERTAKTQSEKETLINAFHNSEELAVVFLPGHTQRQESNNASTNILQSMNLVLPSTFTPPPLPDVKLNACPTMPDRPTNSNNPQSRMSAMQLPAERPMVACPYCNANFDIANISYHSSQCESQRAMNREQPLTFDQ